MQRTSTVATQDPKSTQKQERQLLHVPQTASIKHFNPRPPTPPPPFHPWYYSIFHNCLLEGMI